jgi:DNA-binding Lrp family transcriptional regulator
MDAIDDHILRELQRDGRVTNLELAERIGLSPSACLRRVQALETAGVIKGYRAILDRTRTWRRADGFRDGGTVGPASAGRRAFEAAMAKAPEVLECHNITGSVEYLLRVEVSDLSRLQALPLRRPGDAQSGQQHHLARLPRLLERLRA